MSDAPDFNFSCIKVYLFFYLLMTEKKKFYFCEINFLCYSYEIISEPFDSLHEIASNLPCDKIDNFGSMV